MLAREPLADDLKSGLMIFAKIKLNRPNWLMIFAPAKHHKTSNLGPVSPVGRPFKKLISNPACILLSSLPVTSCLKPIVTDKNAAVEAAKASQATFKFGEQVKLECKNKASGSKITSELTCTSDGKYSGTQLFCGICKNLNTLIIPFKSTKVVSYVGRLCDSNNI